MTVSVVIPYYNDSPVFERCLNSVYRQTRPVDEVIIVDDCSNDSDKLRVIIERYDTIEKKIKYVRNQENKNGAYSRNIGMNIASSKYIALLDADDFWLEDHIETCLENIRDVDYVFSNVIRVYRNGGEEKRKVNDPTLLSTPFDIIFESPPQTSSFFFRATVINKVLFDESLRRHQDYQFLCDLIMSGVAYKYVDAYTTCYVQSHRALSSRYDFESSIKFFDERESLFTQDKLKRFLLRVIIGKLPMIQNELNYYCQRYQVLNFLHDFKFLLLASKVKNKRIKSILKSMAKILYRKDR
ncbi:glycosyltransferase family 2 protein [Aeromonas veronii]|nr:glycosyltransferase family 2 protein [Aeromonas veronii]